MEFEIIILCKVTQIQKDKYCMFSLIHGASLEFPDMCVWVGVFIEVKNLIRVPVRILRQVGKSLIFLEKVCFKWNSHHFSSITEWRMDSSYFAIGSNMSQHCNVHVSFFVLKSLNLVIDYKFHWSQVVAGPLFFPFSFFGSAFKLHFSSQMSVWLRYLIKLSLIWYS